MLSDRLDDTAKFYCAGGGTWKKRREEKVVARTYDDHVIKVQVYFLYKSETASGNHNTIFTVTHNLFSAFVMVYCPKL